MTGHGADPDQGRVGDHVPEFEGQVVDVDEVFGVRDAQLHHRQQAVAAGDYSRPLPQPIQQSDRMVDTGCTFIFKGPGYLHVAHLTRKGNLSVGRADRGVNSELSDR
ncbi:hypothetical protein ATCCBAA256_05870 [Mycobacterium montefiorense]|nr:hypothetical protein ATCCBAA256_05870 [Mycobacterium montefiorense]